MNDSEKIEFKYTMGWLIILSHFNLFINGIFCITLIMLIFGLRTGILLFGIFILVIIFYSLSSSGIKLDRESGIVTQWWGIFLPLKRRIVHFNEITGVIIEKTEASGFFSILPVYRIRLEFESKSLKIGEWKNEIKARANAESLAKFFNVKLTDKSASTETIHDPNDLELTLREKWKSSSKNFSFPKVPEKSHIITSTDSDKLKFRLPSLGYMLSFVFNFVGFLIIAVICVILIGVVSLAHWQIPDFSTLQLELAAILFTWGIVSGTIRDANYYEEITIDGNVLRIKYISAFQLKMKDIPLAEIKELLVAFPSRKDFIPDQVIIARSGNKTLEFGRRLNDADLEWLRGVILSLIYAGESGNIIEIGAG